MKFIHTILFLFYFSHVSLCQSDWKDGYVITANNDTLVGQICHLAYKTMGEECRFRIGPKSTAISYYPKDIMGYAITNFAYYVSRSIDGEGLVFLEYLVDGKLDLFYLRSNDKDRYFIQTDTLPTKEIKYEEEVRTNDQGRYLYRSTTHVGLVALYTKDAPELYDRIKNIKNDYNNLKSFVIDYHNKVCKDIKCISYNNKDNYIKIAIGPHFGYTQQNYHIDAKDVTINYFNYGIYVRVWSERINKNFFVKTGAIISKFDEFTHSLPNPRERKTTIKIPLQFEYLIPIPFKIRPRVSLGFNYFTNYDIYFISGIGADLVVDKNVSLSVGFERGIKNVLGFGFSDETNNTIILGAYYQL